MIKGGLGVVSDNCTYQNTELTHGWAESSDAMRLMSLPHREVEGSWCLFW